jgi:DNA-directed RNA polymerase subunit E'/Rpb7
MNAWGLRSVLSELQTLEGKCVEEGYIQKHSIEIVTESCGVVKGHQILIQVVFKCSVANPSPGQVLNCIVETNTRAGIKARLQSDESPFIVFLARDHHLTPEFSDIKEHEKIKVTVLGQRFEVNDPKISVIATLLEVSKESVPESKAKHVEHEPDVFSFYFKSANKPPGKGVGESGNPKQYPELSKKVDWRKQLSPFDVAEFTCTGSPSDGITFPEGSAWRTLEHYGQACKLYLADASFANLLRLGEKYGNGEGSEALELKNGKKGVDKHPVILTPDQLHKWEEIKPIVMYIGAKAKFSQHKDKMEILCATKRAKLMHNPGRGSDVSHFTHYEKVREEFTNQYS